ncbi:MAG: SET domain-containing protein-lysine N-methyltransferase [Anaerolineae bacterium]|nr:SET domain-containing protein-lysine N-methyltransferase [Anaerolineae bacterium]
MSDARYLSSTWFHPDLIVKLSSINGQGLFATEPLSAGTTIMVWGGTLYTRQELADIRAGKIKVAEFSYSFIEEDLLLAGPANGMDYYVNHSCDPSVWMADNVTVIARRDIAKGEEITGDYAVWEADQNYVLPPCTCGSTLCRKHVTGNDWMRPELQKRYAGHFLPYIARRIMRSQEKS